MSTPCTVVIGAGDLLETPRLSGHTPCAPIPLKPQQRVRMILGDDLGLAKFSASVAWASFEIPRGVSRYRAGGEFNDAEVSAFDAFCMRHKS